jgi:hypothetical protein
MANAKKLMMAAAGGPKKYVYVADYDATAIRTIDVTDPASPSVVATLTDATNFDNITCLAIDLANNVLIAACFDTKVNAIDISNPLSLSVSDTYTFAAGTYTRHEGSLAIDTANQRVWLASGSSNYLYALDYSTPTSLSIAGSFNSAADADNLQNTMYVTSSQGDQSGEYVFSYEADDDTLVSYDVSTIGSITHDRTRAESTYIGTSQAALYYDDTNAWMWSASDYRITAVDMNANGNAIPSGAWSYGSSSARSGTLTPVRNIETGCLVVDESRKYGFTCGTYQVSTWDFSTSGLSKTASDSYDSESLFFKGLAYDETNQILYAAEQNDFYIFDVSDITNMTLSGSITDAVTLMYQGNGCVLGYDPTA